MNLVYDNNYIIGNDLSSRFLSDLDALCRRDYKGIEYFHRKIVCLDMDAYETSLSGNNDATMDASIGIASYDNNTMKESRHLLVELRFNYKSTNNFDVTNMRKKVSHTKDLLSGDKIHDKFVFIYTDEVASKAKSYFSRLSKQHSDIRCWDAVSVSEYFNYIRDKNDFPYQPINNLDQIKENLNKKYYSGGINGLNEITEYWIGRMNQYNLQYNKEESNAIARVVLNYWEQLPPTNDSYEKEYVDIVKDSLTFYLL